MSRREALLDVSSAEFRDIAVSPCKVQKPGERFGHGAIEVMDARTAAEIHSLLYINAGVSSDSEDEAGSAPRPARRKPPKLQNWRMNLTALSQVYNLYFGAYRNKIWVYCPAGPMAQGLGEKPALVINHDISSVGANIPTRIQGWKQDEANHMIIGFLGDAEILLLCYENGDVVSYYTREIAAHIAHRARNPDSAPRPCPSPFFEANVGNSAWGLAIHSKTRLIAVSSNRPEVTVFAFALTHAPAPETFLTPPVSLVESAVLVRKRNWRIVLPVKPTGHNIPSVDFVSCAQGHAQKVSAVDINGNIWLLDIWRQETAPALIVPQDLAWINSDRQMLWAVVALPSSSFMELGARRYHAPRTYVSAEASHARAIALGNKNISIQLPFKNSRYWVDTSSAVSFIQDSRPHESTQSRPLSSLLNPLIDNITPTITTPAITTPAITTAAPTEDPSGNGEEAANDSVTAENGDDDSDDVLYDQGQPDTDENEGDGGEYDLDDLEFEISSFGDEDEDEDEVDVGFTVVTPIPDNADAKLEQYLPKDMAELPEQRGESVNGQPAPRMGMIYAPHTGTSYREPADDRRWTAWLQRRKEHNLLSNEQSQEEIAALGEHTSLLVTDAADLRLLTTSQRFVDIYCRGPAGPNWSHPAYARTRRLNMTLHVPELNLVVAACQSGRVALVTLVRCPWALPTVCGDRSARVDRILPTAAEEARRSARSRVPLFGIAMGPVQEIEDGTLRLRARDAPASFSRTYRLVLHFRDHTIISYLVSRPSPDDLQVI